MSFSQWPRSVIVLSVAFSACTPDSQDAEIVADDCPPSGDYGYVCGLQNPEDLVLLPDSKWVVASGMEQGAPIYLIDSETRQWSELYPGTDPQSDFDTNTYQTCPGEPDLSDFNTHGLNVRMHSDGRTMLYAVGHGERESVEVFELDVSSESPVAQWVGCVLLPEGLEANSVASLDDGSLLATVPLDSDLRLGDAFSGQSTGAVYDWSPGGSDFERIQGTELPFPNGIEVSADESEIFVASTALATVIAFDRADPARQLRRTQQLPMSPDNLRMVADGRLVTAGILSVDPVCGAMPAPADFGIEAFVECPRGFIASSIDPTTMEHALIAQGTANESFGNATVAIPVGDEIWLGTFSGDRIGLVTRN